MTNQTIESLKSHLAALLKNANPEEKEDLEQQYSEFVKLFTRFLETKGSSIVWDKIEHLTDASIVSYETLIDPDINIHTDLLSKLVVVKLNGGLGTSMGCKGPKSLIVVKDKRNFLELTIEQMKELNKKYNVKIPLVLMNSFNTDVDTESILEQFRTSSVLLYSFNQSCFPRIAKSDLMPIAESPNVKEQYDAWYPPGHGDFYGSFWESGLLERLISEGKELCFLSNIDNLGATVDIKILNLILHHCAECPSPDFVMEVTDKTRADVKGGTLIKYEGKVSLLELAQVPDDHVNDFKSIKLFKYFNTNNLWIKLKSIDTLMKEDRLQLDVIVNNKSLSSGQKVIQLETAVGSAMKYFNNSLGVNVPRSRFSPVKKTSDLILMMSNLYELDNGTLVVSPKRTFPSLPILSLDEKYFKNVDSALARFKGNLDLLDLDNLIVSGNVTFGKGVSLKGTVVIITNEGHKIDIPSGAVLENNIVEGDFRIADY